MFKATLSKTDLLKNSIPIIAEIIDEGIFTVDKNGLSLLSPDRTMVSVVDFKLLSSVFDEFEIESKQELGINLTNLSAILKRIKSADKLVLESDGSKLKIRMIGKSTRTFELPLIDVKMEKPPIEQLKFSGSVEIESGILEEGIADAELVSDAVTFEAAPDYFKMLAKGDISSTELELHKGDPALLSLKVQEKIRAQYPLDYLKKMIKATKLAKEVSLEFGTDYPMRMNFKAIDRIQLSFILAPRVQE